MSIRYGTSCGPASHSTVATVPPCWEETTDSTDSQDSWDPDKLLQCPYDANHQIRVCRFPYHLIKCSKNHPELSGKLKTCPFNARHLMPKHELSHHIANCVDRRSVNADDVSCMQATGGVATQSKFQVPVSTWTSPVSEEDWDLEEDTAARAFVWGVSTSQIPQNRAEPISTNSLTPGLRAPRTLPWKLGLNM